MAKVKAGELKLGDWIAGYGMVTRITKGKDADWLEIRLLGARVKTIARRIDTDVEVGADTVVVEVMPAYLRESHRQARNWGAYPHNGARRYLAERLWAEELTVAAEYDHIVRDATATDLAQYDELPESW